MFLNEVDSKRLLKEAGINIIDALLAQSRDEAAALSEKIGFPVALKVVSSDIVHKTDVGGVKLNLRTIDEVKQAYGEIIAGVSQKVPNTKISAISVQKMAPSGVEVIIGMTRDPQFGAVLMFGLGGVWVELLRDVSFRVIPIGQPDAAEMIKELKGFKLLAGFRGQPAVNIAALEKLLVQVSDFIQANPRVTEMDLNPVIAYPDGAVAVDARISTESDARIDIESDARIDIENEKIRPTSNQAAAAGSLDFLFYPKSVAVVGASNSPSSRGYDFMEHLIDFRYQGEIYPISLKSPEVMGIRAYPALEAVPGNVEHVIYCIGLENMPDFLDSCHKKGVKSVHIFSARGAETGRADALALESVIKNKATEYGIRLLGPNCMGVYCPDSGFSFCGDFLKEAGDIGAIIQSGGSSTDVARFGALRGLRFSKLVSYGNALDINEMDLLRYLSGDPKTKVIIAFIEGLRGDGQEFLELVRRTTINKPFIVCKGGKSQAGARAARSHTASLAGSSAVWDTAIRQAGGIPVRDIDDLINVAAAFSLIPPIKGRRVGTGGSGGGRNTVTVDEWESRGFEVVPLPQSVREEFKRRGALLWDCLDNPVDRSITIPGDAFTVPALLMEMAKLPDYDFICSIVGPEDNPYNREMFNHFVGHNVDGYIKLHRESPKPFFTIFADRPLGEKDMDYWLWREAARIRTRLIEAGVPFFPSVDKAADAVNEMINYYQHRQR